MKKISVFIVILSVLFVSCKEKVKEEKVNEVIENSGIIADALYKVNPNTSTLNWKGFKPTGSHNGTVNLKGGILNVREGKLVDGKIVFEMNTIKDLDIPENDEYNAKLVGHLKSADFFDVENNPTATFVITEVVEGDEIIVSGNLTIKEITKLIQFPVSLKSTESGIELSSKEFKIDRTDFDIKFKSQKFFNDLKDQFINDEIVISFNLNASK